MSNKEGKKMKYTVIENEDIDKLDTISRAHLKASLSSISENRTDEAKFENSYIVINTDESYVDEVIEILKHHGHWSGK